jgi:hypothetical protein
MWVIYDGLAGSIGGVINDLLVIVSSVVGLIRYDRKKVVVSEENTDEQS